MALNLPSLPTLVSADVWGGAINNYLTALANYVASLPSAFVTSVAGRTGTITLTAADVAGVESITTDAGQYQSGNYGIGQQVETAQGLIFVSQVANNTAVPPTTAVTNASWRFAGAAIVPLAGGTTGQVRTKNSGTNFDEGWSTSARLSQAGQQPAETPSAPARSSSLGALASAARADHVHVTAGADSFCGDGSDGNLVFDGTNTFASLFIVKSGNFYILATDLHAGNITVNAGVTLYCGAFVIAASGTLTNNGTISAQINTSAGAVGAAGNSPSNSTLMGSRGGGSGAIGAGGASSNNGIPQGFLGGAGGNGGASGSNAGGVAANVTPVAVRALRRAPSAFTTFIATNTSGGASFFAPAWPGTGGGGGGGDGTNAGGGGGSSGGVVVVCARYLAGGGNINANGGSGAPGVGGNASGGGGGGGGVCVVNITDISSWTGTVTAAGGSAGAGVGTGSAGFAGTTGLAVLNVW